MPDFTIYTANDFSILVTIPAVDAVTGKSYKLSTGTASVFLALTDDSAATPVITGTAVYATGAKQWLCSFEAEQLTAAARTPFASSGGFVILTHSSGVRVKASIMWLESRQATIEV